MKKILTLSIIASTILISVSCQKEDLPVSAASNSACAYSRSTSAGQFKLANTLAEKQITNAVACKVCHANKENVEN